MTTSPAQLPSCPFQFISQLIPINDVEFLVIPQTIVPEADGIYKYNINDDEWTKIFDLKHVDNYVCLLCHSVAFDKSNKIFYICSSNVLRQFDLNSKSMTILAEDLQVQYYFPMMCCINDELHLIDSLNHYIFDKQKKIFCKTHEFHMLTKTDKKVKNNYWGGALNLWLNNLMRLSDFRNVAAKEFPGLFDWKKASKAENKYGRYDLKYIETYLPELLPNDRSKKIFIELEKIKRNHEYKTTPIILIKF
eukprot:460471_1